MRSLVALVKNIIADAFNSKVSAYSSTSRKRFIMEPIETRVLLSADPAGLAALIDMQDPTNEESIVLLLTDGEGSGSDAVDFDFDADSPIGIKDHGEEGEEEEGDFIEPEAYDETYGEFDFDEFLERELGGPLGGPGGAVLDDTYPTDALTNNNGGATPVSAFTQSETSVIAFGNTVLVAFNDSGSTSGGTNKFTGFSRSTDDGLTFTDGGTLPTNPAGDGGDPVLARNATTGRIYFSTLSQGGAGTIQVFRSDDAGLTWMAPVNGTPGGSGEDKQWHTVDNFVGPGNGNVYLVSRRFGGPAASAGIYFFRSTDNGNTFGPNGGTLITLGNQGAFVAVAPDHSVYVFWFAGTTIQMRKSTDQGLTFGAPVTVASGLVGPGNGELLLTGIRQGTATASGFRNNSFPHAAINPVNGNIYVTYNSDGAGNDRADVFVVQSTNGGLTWSAPFKVNDDATITDQWQPTLAVTPDGKKLGIFYSSRQEDPSGNNLFKYYGRIADINLVTGALSFTPSFAISDTPSLPEFGRDGLVVSTYMGDYNSADATDGFFHVTWSDNRDDLPNGAGRKDPNVYYKAIDLGLTVRSTLPAQSSVVSSIPLTYTVNFSDKVQATSLNASDFTVDAIAASSFTINSDTQVTFGFLTAPFSTQGLHTMAIAASAILRDSDLDPIAAFSGTFRYDALQLQVVSTAPPVSGVFTLPAPFTYDVIFNEAINPASVQTWDLVVGGLTGATVSAFTVLPGNTTARFTITGIVDQGTMTANIMAGAILDQFGNPGAAFSASYAVDLVTAPYPTPLIAKNPLGSLIYDPSVTGTINFAGDVDNFTLNVDPNQTISLILTPTVTLFPVQPRIEIFDPNNISLASATAPAVGQIAGIETVHTTVGGVYTFAVSGANSTVGPYTLQAILNSEFELEGRVSGSTNNDLIGIVETTINATDSGFIQANGFHTATVNGYLVGQSTFITPVMLRDYFTFTLPATTPTIVGAELRLLNTPTGYTSPDPNETYTLYDVSATPAVLDTTRPSNDLTGIEIFADLGSGLSYGERLVSAADNNTTVAISLNPAAVTALNSRIGSTISFGGAISTLSGTATQLMFSGTSGAAGTVQLVLRTTVPTQNIDNSFITVGPPQAGAERGAVSGQTDVPNYIATAVSPTFEDISGTGTVIAGLTNQDNTAALISFPIGFTFPFFAVNNTTMFVTSNGLLSFGGASALGANTDLTTTPAQATIAPFWDDLNTGGGVPNSNVFFQVLGSGTNQHLTVQWNNVRFQSGGTAGDNITFQTQLYADGRIQFNYLDLISGTAAGNNGASATVGVKAAGTQGPNRLVLALNNGPNTFVGTGKSTLLTLSGPPFPDYYSFALDAGETVTLAATGQTPGNLTLQLRDSSDSILATGVGGSRNLTSVISDFTVATGGIYYARITSDSISGVPYSLVITKNASFDREDNNTPGTAQTLIGAGVLGSIFVPDNINAVDSGWVATDGTHIAANNNYIVGQVPFNGNPLSQFRDYFTFNLSATMPAIAAAELRVFNPANAYVSPDSTETYTLFDVSATAADLDANRNAGDATGIAIHGDLGSGAVYGSRAMSAADNNTTVVIPLNTAAIAALNSRTGSTISFGGAITTLQGTAQQSAFGFSTGALGTVQLVLQTQPDDWYSITVPTTAHAVRLATRTPGDGPGQFVNTLNPHIELYDNSGTTLIGGGVTGPDGRNEALVATGLTPGGTYKVRVSRQGSANGEYFLSTNFNFTPVLTNVTVGSPIDENDTATVSGTFSDADAIDSHTVVINWGTNEGSTTFTLAPGVSTFSASHQYLDDNPTGTASDVYIIGVTVTDILGGSDSENVSLTVNNVAPVVAAISSPSSGVRGQVLDFSSSFTDVGTLDTHEVRWNFGDGTVIDYHSTNDPNALAVSHLYTTDDAYTVTLSIRDDDGSVTSVTKDVTITAVALQADPCDPDKIALVVGGTTGNDTIAFSPQGNGGDVVVLINDVSQGVFHPTGHIVVFGQAGDDDIQLAGSIQLDAWLFGGAGNDRLKGAAGGSILIGGDGDDQLNGGSGRSIIVGGRGKDRGVGGGGDDILIGGITTYEGDIAVLCALSDVWSSSDPYAVRLDELRNLLVHDTTVIDDNEVDSLTGSSGRDWFFAGVGDTITRIQDDESTD